MLNSKQRAYLRSLANKIDPIFNVGKSGVEESFLKQVEDALEARELIKISVLKNNDMEVREVCDLITDRTGSDGVQIIGNKCVIYKRSNKKPRIELP